MPSIGKKKITAAFDGGTISSDGGVFLLACADRRLGLTEHPASLVPDARDQDQLAHPMADLLRERVPAIACGYPDCNDLTTLRRDPAFKMAAGACRKAAPTWPPSQPCHGWTMPPACAT